MYILNIHIHFSILWAFFENACVSLLNQPFFPPGRPIKTLWSKVLFF